MSIVLSPCGSNTITLVEELDESQAALLFWGSTIPWAWWKFDDPRTFQFETVIKLVSAVFTGLQGCTDMQSLKTANWIYHVGNLAPSSFGDMQPTEEDVQLIMHSSTQVLQHALRLRPNASIIALFVGELLSYPCHSTDIIPASATVSKARLGSEPPCYA